MDDFSPVLTLSPPVLLTNTQPSQSRSASVAPQKKPYLPFDVSQLVTEDDEPVDNIPSSKQQRCAIDPLYSTSYLPHPFLADSNIALYSEPGADPIVPDVFLSMNVTVADEWWEKENRSYLLWEFGKPPEMVMEIVSNKKGGEASHKITTYANMDIQYYVVYDPQLLLSDTILCVYELLDGEYLPRRDYRLPSLGLSLTLWRGVFEAKEDLWLRWCDRDGNLLPTGAEYGAQEHQRADHERQRAIQADIRAEQYQRRARQAALRAEEEHQRAEQEKQRAEQANLLVAEERKRTEILLEQLRSLGIEPKV